MIQKNTEDEVQEHTGKAASLLQNLRRDQSADVVMSSVEDALKQVCNLKGVGPATGTLVLCVFQPDIVPFFEDELFFWLHPDHTGKLKYDKKEYMSLLTKALEIILDRNIEARALEKTAYVVMHADQLGADERMQIEQAMDGTGTANHTEEESLETKRSLSNSSDTGDQPKAVESGVKRPGVRRKASKEVDADTNLRRSKRKKT